MNALQQEMFSEMKHKAIFEKATQFGLSYLDQIFDRDVFPSEEALQNLKHFDEPLPTKMSSADEVLTLLHEYDAPATIAQVGGRYFGFVCGGVVPVGMAAKQLATFWDQNCAMHVLSPLASKLEKIVELWLRDLLQLPDNVVAGFVSGTSKRMFCFQGSHSMTRFGC